MNKIKNYKPIKKGFIRSLASKISDVAEKTPDAINKAKKMYNNFESMKEKNDINKIKKLKRQSQILAEQDKIRRLREKNPSKWSL